LLHKKKNSLDKIRHGTPMLLSRKSYRSSLYRLSVISFYYIIKQFECQSICRIFPLSYYTKIRKIPVSPLEGTRFPQGGAAPWNPASFFERKKQRSRNGRKLRFRQELLAFSLQKTQFFAMIKVFGVQGDFSKIPLAGCRAEPCGYGGRGSPQGVPPLGTPLLSLKERSKEAEMAENSVFGRSF